MTFKRLSMEVGKSKLSSNELRMEVQKRTWCRKVFGMIYRKRKMVRNVISENENDVGKTQERIVD